LILSLGNCPRRAPAQACAELKLDHRSFGERELHLELCLWYLSDLQVCNTPYENLCRVFQLSTRPKRGHRRVCGELSAVPAPTLLSLLLVASLQLGRLAPLYHIARPERARSFPSPSMSRRLSVSRPARALDSSMVDGYSKLSLQDDSSNFPPSSHPPPARPAHRPMLWLALSVFAIAVLSLASLHPQSQEQLKRLSHYTWTREYKTAVGPRSYSHLYQGCNLTELLLDLKESRFQEDGPSSFANFTLDPYDPTDNAPAPFTGFSFDMNTCPPPHVFTQDEACDLIAGFGALLFSGDSFIRHVWDALLIFLTGEQPQPTSCKTS
jgi:hypothetical protein